jgi:uncharacterized protein (TIGR02594 family)
MVIAAQDVGVRELPGVATHPRIATYYQHTNLGGEPEDGAVAWCSAAMCCWIDEAGYIATSRANARSWLGWGEALKQPRLGCIVVFSRGNPSGKQGHVAIYVSPGREGHVVVLGGNQGGAVSFQNYPSARILGYRWPKDSDWLTSGPDV